MPEPLTTSDATTSPSSSGRTLAAAVFALALPSLVTWAYFYEAEEAAAGVQLVVFSSVKILQFAFPLAWAALVERERISLRPASARGLISGAAFGFAVVAAALALYRYWLAEAAFFQPAAAEIRARIAGWGIERPWQYALLGLFYTLGHSFLEEYYWRWFVFARLRRFMSVGLAISISALGFMAHHVLVLGSFFGFDHPATWFFSSCVAVGGAFWAWLYVRSGSLLGPWLSHALVDAAIFLVGYQIVRPMFAA